MRIRKCFFGKQMYWSDVVLKKLLYFLVFLVVFGNLPLTCRGQNDRESRKLFGGYRITPTYCKASRAAKFNRGNTICMFNHECIQRGGEVVGTCMDGFLFGACCQLKSDSQSHFPKGPGVVMTSYLDYPDPELETADYEADQLNILHNSFKPIVTPGYKPSSSSSTTPDNLSTEAEIISEGVNQIASTLLNGPPKESELIYVRPKPDYTHSSIDHGPADTILVHTNGTIVDTVVRPSDFNIQISAMQTKPTTVPSTTTTTQKPVSTHRPIKPVFKPKPIKTSTENYVKVSTVTKDSQKPEVSSIDSIIQMLNDSTPSVKEGVTSPGSLDVMETKSSPVPATLSPIFSSTFSYYPSTGHYVTLKPSSISTKTPYTTKKPVYEYVYTTADVEKYSSPRPASQYTSQAIEAFNKYPTDPADFDNSVTTFSYVSTTTTPNPAPTRRPPSTSYITGGPNPLRRPVTPPSSAVSSYDVPPETFSSATPTVIVLHNYPPKPTSTEENEPQFVEISQEPFKKPVSQITVNNHIASTNNIYVGKPPAQNIRPSSPTVLITPKPAPITTPYPIKGSVQQSSSSKPIDTRPWSSSTSRPVDIKPWSSSTTRPTDFRPWPTISTTTYIDFTEYSPTTFKPELQTSPDDLINFPPVRNPLLNATGSNPAIFNTSISLSDGELSDIDLIHELQFTTPTWQEDEQLKEKMSVFVSKIVGSLQGTFQELHDIVILDKKQNTTLKTTTAKPKKTLPTKKPLLTTRKPIRVTTTTRRPTIRTTRKPVRATTPVRRTTPTTPVPTTTATASTKKPVQSYLIFQIKPDGQTNTSQYFIVYQGNKVTTTKKKPVKKVTTTALPTSTTEVEEVTTENYADQAIDYNDRNLCGVRPLAKSGRIVGGKNARFGEWPWQVLVRESTWLGLFTKNKCGGVLISSRYVTTAAHCQPGFLASLVAVFGENDISGDKEPKSPVSRNVRRVIVHREYDAATFENDLAILELDSPIKFDAHIVPICMPPDEADFTGRMATVTGWGRLKYGGGVPAVLQEVQVPVIENSACQDMFQTAGHDKKILNSFICAGYANGQKDSCEGDSGGPLVLQRDDGRWQLVGTVSHGIKCAAPFLPGVYMRTTYYKPWLKSITGVH